MNKRDFDVIKVDYWECPEGNGIPILTMPNIPKPLHGKGMQPRTIYGKTVWDFMRKKCYYNAEYRSEISGEEPPKGQLHSHELFSYDYAVQRGTFIRCIALTKMEHDFIHSGRLITLYREGNPMVPRSYLLKVVENGFKLINLYNTTHKDKEPLRAYATFLEYLEEDSIRDSMIALIKKYKIKFYEERISKSKRWKGWHVIVGDKKYMTPYSCETDWRLAMEEARKTDNVRNLVPSASGDGAKAVDEILNEMKKK